MITGIPETLIVVLFGFVGLLSTVPAVILLAALAFGGLVMAGDRPAKGVAMVVAALLIFGFMLYNNWF